MIVFVLFRTVILEFPSFQDMLLQEKFATLVVKMCTDDPESTVRACALKCLQEMIQSTLVWSERLEQHEVPVNTHNDYHSTQLIIICLFNVSNSKKSFTF